MNVNILGTEYEIAQNIDPAIDKSLEGRFGYCDTQAKKIVCADLEKVDDWKDEPEAIRASMNKTTLRHELFHAFLYESGLWGSSLSTDSWATNEEMTDWLALQFPKILAAMQKVGAI